MISLTEVGGDSKFPHFWGKAWERESKGKELSSVYPLLLSHKLVENESVWQSPQYVLSQARHNNMKDSTIFSLVYSIVKHWNGGVSIPGGVEVKTAHGSHCHHMVWKVVSQRLDLIISEVYYNLCDSVILWFLCWQRTLCTFKPQIVILLLIAYLVLVIATLNCCNLSMCKLSLYWKFPVQLFFQPGNKFLVWK